MLPNISPPNPIQPLSVGNVVSAGVRLYRSNLKIYLQLALVAHLWFLVPIYGWAKYAAISGLISRLAFGELINKPESVKTARSKINSRLWSFLRVTFQFLISLALIYIGLTILGGIIMGIVLVILMLILGNPINPSDKILLPIPIFQILIAIELVGVLVGLMWYYSRWIVAEVPLAVEESINGGESIARSWELTKTSALRIQGIVLIAFVVTLPILFLFNYLDRIFFVGVEPGSTTYRILIFISDILSLAGVVFVMPFWQAIKAILYYDLRSRREGFGLQLREHNL